MKRFSLLSLLTLIICSSIFAQVREERLGMIRGVKEAMVVTLPDAEQSYVEKQWRDFMRKYGKVEKIKKTKEWLIQSANLVNYDNIGRVNIYSEALDKEGVVELAVWVEVDSTFINSKDNPEAYASGVELLEDFAIVVEVDLINTELEQHQKVLDKYESNLNRLESNHTKYNNTIDQSHKSIALAEDNIVKNQHQQEETSVEMDGYRNLSDDPDSQKQLNKLEKKMNRLKKDDLAYHTNIAKGKDKIEQAEGDIEKNLADQENVKKEIEDQKVMVQDVRARLSAARTKK